MLVTNYASEFPVFKNLAVENRGGKNIAMGFVYPAYAGLGTQLHDEVIGEPVPAEVVDSGLYDPDNRLVRQ